MIKKLTKGSAANPKNIIQLHESELGCCPNGEGYCEYCFEGEGDLTGITAVVEGETKTILFDAATTPKEKRLALCKAIREMGYDPTAHDMMKGVSTEDDVIYLRGELEVQSLVIGGETVTAEKRCTLVNKCKYQVVTAENFTVTVGDTETAIENLETAVATLNAIEGVSNATSSLDEVDQLYTITFDTCETVLIDGEAIPNCGCTPAFIAGIDPCAEALGEVNDELKTVKDAFAKLADQNKKLKTENANLKKK